MKRVVIVIPVHKSDPTPNEIASLKQCYKILGSHSIKILAPTGLNMTVYHKAVPKLQVINIDSKWLSSIEQYNNLKISRYFYELFRDHEFLLTYELDAWVFRDELEYWCDKGYDYIGAPWFEKCNCQKPEEAKIGGNSGFSLRNISVARNILARRHYIFKLRKFWYRSMLQSLYRFEGSRLIERIFRISFTPEFKGVLGALHYHEDLFWARYIPMTFPDYKVAPPEEAMKFSFEVNPSLLYKKNGRQLSFGCHAWEKYEPDFWKDFIKTE